jgi:hypothetical protein
MEYTIYLKAEQLLPAQEYLIDLGNAFIFKHSQTQNSP